MISVRQSSKLNTRVGRSAGVTARLVVARAQVQSAITSAEAIEQASKICDEGTAAECSAAWDKVERIVLEEQFQIKRRLKNMRTAAENKFAAAAALEKQVANDPLEKFCAESPDADECRVYE